MWRWKPLSCRLSDFRPLANSRDTVDILLEKLGNAKIAHIGDSIALEHYLSLEVRCL